MVNMMNNRLQLVLLLQEKKQLYSRFEHITNEMSALSPDDFQASMEAREGVLTQIKELDNRVIGLCYEDDAARHALNAQCDRGALAEDLAQIYDTSMSVRGIMNRILKNESTLRQMMEDHRAKILEKIEELNTSGLSVADKYSRSLEGAVAKPGGPERERHI